jgi:hypothetical protein
LLRPDFGPDPGGPWRHRLIPCGDPEGAGVLVLLDRVIRLRTCRSSVRVGAGALCEATVSEYIKLNALKGRKPWNRRPDPVAVAPMWHLSFRASRLARLREPFNICALHVNARPQGSCALTLGVRPPPRVWAWRPPARHPSRPGCLFLVGGSLDQPSGFDRCVHSRHFDVLRWSTSRVLFAVARDREVRFDGPRGIPERS